MEASPTPEAPEAPEADTATEETPAPAPTIETVDLSTFEDETRVKDTDAFRAFMAGEWLTAVKAGAREAVRATNAAKALARARVTARGFLIRASGFPDWSGDSDAYKRSVSVTEYPIMSGLDRDTKARLDGSVRQHVKRSFMLPTIVQWILTNEANFGDELTKYDADASSVLGDPSAALKSRVRAHYRAAKLTLPDGPFQEGAPAPRNPGNPDEEPQNVLASLKDALGGLTQIVPRLSTAAVLQTLTVISAKLIEGKINEVEGRPKVIAQLERLGVIATQTAAAVKGDVYDEEALKAAYWTTQDKAE